MTTKLRRRVRPGLVRNARMNCSIRDVFNSLLR